MPGPSKNLFPPGHFYSPIPSIEDILRDEARIFGRPPRLLPGVELNEEDQVQLIERFSEFYSELPFGDDKKECLRYFFKNPAYSYTDGIFLYSMIRFCNPKRIIEIGSGFSSCVILDTNEIFFQNKIACTFIEPHPDLLISLLRPGDQENIRIIGNRVQDVPLELFENLECGDILLIDSTHVSKTGSDVNYIIFEVMPALNPHVMVHFHDIFYPFEYPKRWVLEGRAWNECYMLRAFLQYNLQFKIRIFANFLVTFYKDLLLKKMPKCGGNFGGNIWLERV